LGRGLTAAALAGLAGAYAVRAGQQRWSTEDDPCGPEGLRLPAGTARTVTTDDGADIAVVDVGPADGPTVVLAHCWTGTKELWAAVARRLVAAGHRVVLYDQRGHGSSTLGSGPTDAGRLGQDLRTVLEVLDLSEVVLVGHSMGGMTIQALAIEHPEVVAARVQGIVLVATAAFVLPRSLPGPVVDRVLGDLAMRPLARGAMGLAMVRGSVGRTPHRAHVEATRDAFFATSAKARAGFLTGMSSMDYRRGLAGIVVPTTVVVGTHDRMTPVRFAKVLARGIPGAELVVIPDAGHMLPLEAPAAVADAILARSAVMRAASNGS
jgi:non-heme chloroperoxidase